MDTGPGVGTPDDIDPLFRCQTVDGLVVVRGAIDSTNETSEPCPCGCRWRSWATLDGEPISLQRAGELINEVVKLRRGQQITDEINADPEEAERLRESRQQARDGRTRSIREIATEIVERDGEILRRLAQ